MDRLRLPGVACAFFLVVANPSHAATVVTDGNVATAINGLFIGGTPYNVTFSAKDSFDGVFGVGAPSTTFWGNQSGAEAAVDAINAELNTYSSGSIDLVGIGTGTDEFENDYLVPFTFSSGTIVANARGNNGFNVPNVWDRLATFDVDRTTSTVSWAQFTVVPIPAAVWLFGSGLLGLVGVARRKIS